MPPGERHGLSVGIGEEPDGILDPSRAPRIVGLPHVRGVPPVAAAPSGRLLLPEKARRFTGAKWWLHGRPSSSRPAPCGRRPPPSTLARRMHMTEHGHLGELEPSRMTASTEKTVADWKTLAAAELKGKDPAELAWETPEGITVKPLYTATDLEALEDQPGLPGFAPYTRGVRATMFANRPWTIRPVCGLRHRRGVQRLLQAQPCGRAERAIRRLRPRDPPGLRQRPPQGARRRGQGGASPSTRWRT